MPALAPPISPKNVPFDPFSFLSGAGGLPGFTGGDAGPAISEATSGGFGQAIASITAPFVVGSGSAAGGGAPGADAGGFGALTSNNLVFIVGIGAVAWLIVSLRRR